MAYSCVRPLIPDNNNTDLDPEFTDAANNNFTPMLGSPVIDTAHIADWMIGQTDLAGNMRIRGSAPDMGAFEASDADEGELSINFVGDTLVGYDQIEVIFTAFPAGSNTDGLVYVWDFNNDGTADIVGPDKNEVTWSFPVGLHTVRLSVTNVILETAEAIKEGYIFVSPRQIYVSTGGSGYPGTSWANAFTNIHEALNFAIGTNTIYMAGETFDLTQEIICSSLDTIAIYGGYEALAATSGPGPCDSTKWPTIIKCDNKAGSFRCMSVTYMQNFTIERIAFTGGYPAKASTKAYGGGIYVNSSDITINECAITNNQSRGGNNTYTWGGGLFVTTSTANITKSLFADNTAYTSASKYNGWAWGGGFASENSTVYIADCQFINNLANGTGLQGGFGGAIYTSGGDVLIRNSLVVGNAAGSTYACNQGGGAYINNGTILENCTVVANTCYNDGVFYANTAGGLYVVGGYVTNTIVAHNTNTVSVTVTDVYAANLNRFSHSRALELDDGANGNTADDPLLVMTSGKYPLYSLDDGSPCINAGLRLPWMEGATDLAGNRRVSAGGADMGCYERPAEAATIILLR